MDFLKDLPEEQRKQIEDAINSSKTEAQRLQEERDKLLNKNQEVIGEKKTMQQKLQEYQGVNIEEYNKLKSQIENDKYREAFEKFGIEGVEKAIAEREAEKYKSVLTEKEDLYNQALKEKETFQQELDRLKTESEINSTINKLKDTLATESQELIQLVIQRDFERNEEGKLVRKDGKVNSLGQPMSIEDWLNNKETMKIYPSFYKGKSGAGVNGGGNFGGETTKMSPEEFNAHMAKFGPEKQAAEISRLQKEGLI